MSRLQPEKAELDIIIDKKSHFRNQLAVNYIIKHC